MTHVPERSSPGLAPGLLPGVVIASLIGIFIVLGGSAVPFILGWLLCLVLQPLRDRLRRAGLSAFWAVLAAVAAGSLCIGGLLFLLVWAGAAQVMDFIDYMPELLARIAAAVRDVVGESLLHAWAPAVALAAEGRKSGVTLTGSDLIGADVTRLAPYVFGLTGSVWNFVFVCLLTPFIAFYLLKDGPFLLRRAGAWFSRQQALELSLFWTRSKRRLAAFAKGQVLLCLAQGLLHAALLTAIGLRFGFILGMATGIASIIPVLGNFTLFMVSLAVALFQGEGLWLPTAVVAIFALSEVLETVVLAPRLVGTRINVHPLFIIMVLVFGYAVFGVAGALCALPFAAIMSTFFDALDKPNPIENTGTEDAPAQPAQPAQQVQPAQPAQQVQQVSPAEPTLR